MTPFEMVLVVYGVIVSLTTLAVIYRMIVGPTILDRAVSTDSLVVLVAIGMALYTAHTQANWAGPALVGLTATAFIGTVTFARFVAREDTRTSSGSRHREEPETNTGPLEAVHFDSDGNGGEQRWSADEVAPTTLPGHEDDGRELSAHEELPADDAQEERR